ncbi:MAG: hypothetical protein NTX69_06990 [Candidatus Bipolaricaulota bacterium]|nr:hypothetical protein [Candidatus Bipolaricaulota bacterium]
MGFLGVALIIAWALGVSAGEGFTGSWEAEIGLSPQQAQPFTAFQTTLDVGFHVGFVTAKSVSDFVIDGWVWEELGLLADVGLLAFEGTLLYEPQSGSMVYAEGVLSLCYDPMVVSLYGALTQSASAEYGYVLDVKGVLYGGAFWFESATYLGADLSGITFIATGSTSDSTLLTKTFTTDPTIGSAIAMFSGEDVTFGGTLFGCVTLTSLTSFTEYGFESETMTVEFLGVLGLPLTFTLDLVYEIDEKSYVFTPSFETDYGCLSIYSNIVQSGSMMTGVEVYGIGASVTIGNATLQSISNLDTLKYVITTPGFGSIVELKLDADAEGHLYYPQNYWEVLTLVVNIPPLGSGFSFSVETCLSKSIGLLFEWAESTMGITLALGASVSTSTSISVDATGFTSWTLAFRVGW